MIYSVHNTFGEEIKLFRQIRLHKLSLQLGMCVINNTTGAIDQSVYKVDSIFLSSEIQRQQQFT